MRFPPLWTFSMLSFAVVTASCGEGVKADKASAPPPTLVSVVEVTPTDAPIYAEYSAQTFARDLVEVRGRVDGFIQKLLLLCRRLRRCDGAGALRTRQAPLRSGSWQGQGRSAPNRWPIWNMRGIR